MWNIFSFEYIFKTDILKVYEGKLTENNWQKIQFAVILQLFYKLYYDIMRKVLNGMSIISFIVGQ